MANEANIPASNLFKFYVTSVIRPLKVDDYMVQHPEEKVLPGIPVLLFKYDKCDLWKNIREDRDYSAGSQRRNNFRRLRFTHNLRPLSIMDRQSNK